MGDTAEILIHNQYLVMVGLSILFSLLAIYRRTVLADLLAMVCWFISGATHLLASPTSTPFYALSFLYWGFGLIFFVLMWADLFQLFNKLKSTKGVGPL